MYLYWSKFKTLFKSHLLYFMLIISYRIGFDVIYERIIYPIYGSYYKYINNPTVDTIIISWIIFSTFMILTCKYYYSEDGVSNVVLFFIFLISIVPFSTLVKFGQFEYSYICANTLYFFILYFAIGVFKKQIIAQKRRLITRISPDFKIKLLTFFMLFIALFVCGRYSHFRINFSIEQVYDLRSEARTYNIPIVLTYLYSWATWITPFLIGYYIRKKKYIYVVILFLSQVFMFGYDGMKGPFFFAVVVVLINLFLPKMKMSSLNAFFLYGISGVGLLSYVIYFFQGKYMLVQTFFNRLGLIPNVISYAYFKFFIQYPPDYFRTSFLRYFGFKSPYSDISYMISRWYFGLDQGANNGLIADAMTNMGVIGIFIMPIIVAYILRIVDLYTEKLDRRIVVCVALYLTLMLMSMFMLPILLTGGLLIVLLLLNWMSKEETETTRY